MRFELTLCFFPGSLPRRGDSPPAHPGSDPPGFFIYSHLPLFSHLTSPRAVTSLSQELDHIHLHVPDIWHKTYCTAGEIIHIYEIYMYIKAARLISYIHFIYGYGGGIFPVEKNGTNMSSAGKMPPKYSPGEVDPFIILFH